MWPFRRFNGWGASSANRTRSCQKSLPRLEWLELDETLVTDDGLIHLQGMTVLTDIRLNNLQITDSGLENLEGLTSLDFLSLSGTQITDSGLAHLNGLTLQQLLFPVSRGLK